ncbi:MAG: hypothetical protein K1X51_14805 [Rhodospirillaceae bacterium]|nr:hypothetical protein [Rhodospirillaceae bacterium]
MAEAHAKDHKDDKKAPAAKTVKNAKEEDEGPGPGDVPASPVKQRILATALSRAIVISTLIGSAAVLAGTLLSARYELVRGPNTDNNFVYRLDRLTGAVRFCGQQQCTDVGVTTK